MSTTNPPSSAQATIRDYLLILFHRKKFFWLPTIIVFLTATIGSFFLPKYYASSVLLLVQAQEKVINPLADKTRYYYPGQEPTLVEQFKTLTEKILNYPQLRYIVDRFRLVPAGTSPLDVEKVIYRLRKRVDIKLRSPEVFEVIYEDKNPEMAQQIVNELIASFIRYNVETKKRLALTGVKFAESQAEVYRQQLEESEKELYEFRKKTFSQSPGKETEINIQLLIKYQTDLTSTQLDLQQGQVELNTLKAQLDGREPIQYTNELLEMNPIIKTLNERLEQAQINLDNALHNDPSASSIVTLQQTIDDLRRRLSEEIQKTIDEQTVQTSPLLYQQIERNYQRTVLGMEALRKKEAQLKKLVAEYEARISSLPDQELMYARLLRDTEVNSKIYEVLRLKVEENRLDAVELQEKGLSYEVLSEGRLPLKPSKPQKLLIAVIALVLGMIMGFFTVFIVETNDHSFRNREDAKKYLDLPVIGSTMRIITFEEARAIRRRHRTRVVLGLLSVAVAIAFALGYSAQQERELKEKLLRNEIEKEL
ncbi:MAG: hypothetical protein NC924_06610 [Candidatus Omnitrophica bacterium]|nr:hypothetical protein [Candidatus Omnitrophota bacterium]